METVTSDGIVQQGDIYSFGECVPQESIIIYSLSLSGDNKLTIGVDVSKNSADYGFSPMFSDYSMNTYNDLQGPQSSIDNYYGSVFIYGGFSFLGLWHGNSKVLPSFPYPLTDALRINFNGRKQALFPNIVRRYAQLWGNDYGALYDHCRWI